MPYSSGSYSASGYSSGPVSGEPDGISLGYRQDYLRLTMASDGEILANGSGRHSVVLRMDCDGELIAGTGAPSNPTTPTPWKPETTVTTIWTPERPITPR